MHGKLKAALVGGGIGAIVVVLVELLAMVINGEGFFSSERSWLILVFAVVLFAWSQMRAYDRRQPEGKNDPTGRHHSDGSDQL